jgi:hypothetical protein
MFQLSVGSYASLWPITKVVNYTFTHRRKALRVGSAAALVVAVVGLISMRENLDGKWHRQDTPEDPGDVLLSSAVSQGQGHAYEVAPPDESVGSYTIDHPNTSIWDPIMKKEKGRLQCGFINAPLFQGEGAPTVKV